MTITTITATYGRTFQLRPYEPATISYSASADVETGEDVMAVSGELMQFLKAAVEMAARPLLERAGRLQAQRAPVADSREHEDSKNF
jgi:hypothetical protein